MESLLGSQGRGKTPERFHLHSMELKPRKGSRNRLNHSTGLDREAWLGWAWQGSTHRETCRVNGSRFWSEDGTWVLDLVETLQWIRGRVDGEKGPEAAASTPAVDRDLRRVGAGYGAATAR